jgi:hypothetical protein
MDKYFVIKALKRAKLLDIYIHPDMIKFIINDIRKNKFIEYHYTWINDRIKGVK